MLDVAAHYLAAVQHCSRIDRGAAGTTGDAKVSGIEMIEIAHDADQVAESVGDQVSGELMQACHGGVLEGRTQGEILDGVAGEGHLGEDHEVGATLLGEARLAAYQRRVAGQIAHHGVHLGERKANHGHVLSVLPRQLTHS